MCLVSFAAPPECDAGQISCGTYTFNKTYCMPPHWRCDGVKDCLGKCRISKSCLTFTAKWKFRATMSTLKWISNWRERRNSQFYCSTINCQEIQTLIGIIWFNSSNEDTDWCYTFRWQNTFYSSHPSSWCLNLLFIGN